jgi:putative transposase
VRHTGAVYDRLHDGRVAVERSNIRWCSDGFEIGCDNKEKVRVAFALDCCDREAIAHVATTQGIKSEGVQDLVITAVENRFGRINVLTEPIEWLTDNGSCASSEGHRILATRHRHGAVHDTGAKPSRTEWRMRSSKTFKRDYAQCFRISIAARVHQLAIENLSMSGLLGATPAASTDRHSGLN